MSCRMFRRRSKLRPQQQCVNRLGDAAGHAPHLRHKAGHIKRLVGMLRDPCTLDWLWLPASPGGAALPEAVSAERQLHGNACGREWRQGAIQDGRSGQACPTNSCWDRCDRKHPPPHELPAMLVTLGCPRLPANSCVSCMATAGYSTGVCHWATLSKAKGQLSPVNSKCRRQAHSKRTTRD